MVSIFKRGITVFFLALFYISNSYAAGLSIRLERSNIKLSVPPGNSKTGSIKIYNQGSDPTEVKVYLEDWAYTSEQDGTKNFFPAQSTPFSCASWITFSPAQVTLPPYGIKEVNYVINVPSNTTGARYAVMFFESFISQPTESEIAGPGEIRSDVGLRVRLGLLLFIESKDTIKRIAEVSNFSVSRDSKNRYLVIAGDLKNIGNTYTTTAASYHIMDKQGLIYARGEFNDVYTFPGDTAKLTATWKEPIPKGKYVLVLTVNIGKAQEEAGLGRGPVMVKETEIEIGENGEVVRVGELK